jgi:hypothetical protein
MRPPTTVEHKMGQFAFGLIAGIIVGLVMEWVIDWTGLLPQRSVGKRTPPKAGQSSATASAAERLEERSSTSTATSSTSTDASGE